MAIVTINDDSTAMVSVRVADKTNIYKLYVGYKVENLLYEGVKLNNVSGTITNINKENYTITVDDTVIDANRISRIGNRPDTFMTIDTSELDTDTGGEIMDTVGPPKYVHIVFGADSVIEKDEYGPDYQIDIDDYIPIPASPRRCHRQDLIYDQRIQKTSYIQANMAAVFREWFTSFFPPNYFRHIRIKTESAYSAYKSFMKDIYKKEPPLLVIDPNSIEHVDDFLFGTNVVNRYNIVDPNDESIGAKMLYSLAMIETENIALHYRRNRYRFRFDVLMMERTLDRAIDLHNFLIMNMRHQSKFMLFRRVANLIPAHMIRSIAKINGFSVPDDKFMEWINAHAIGCTIVKRTLPNGQLLFFAEQDCHIQVETPDMPAKDSPELSDAIEIAARVTDTFNFIVDLPTEFFCTMDHFVSEQYERYREGDDPELHYITKSDDYSWEKGMDLEMGDYMLFNRADVMIQSADDNTMNLIDIIKDVDPKMSITAKKLLNDPTITLPDTLFRVRIIAKNNEVDTFKIDEKGVLTIYNPDYTKIYHVYVYVNQKYINMYESAINTQFIGTIEKTAY